MATDQQSLNESNYIMDNIIVELDGKWNCQITFFHGIAQHLHNAKIIHYFNSIVRKNIYPLGSKNFFELVKTGGIDQQIKNMLLDSKKFAPGARLVLHSPKDLPRSSALYGLAKRVYFSRLGPGIESVLEIIRKKIFTSLRKKLSSK
jgi:hypothetical protein